MASKSVSPSREALIADLYEMFRTQGFDGLSLGGVSMRTGLGKSSLYYHFPGGKNDMAAAVAAFACGWLRENVIAPLRADLPRADRIANSIRAVRELFDDGRSPCLIASLTMPGAPGPVRETLAHTLADWIDAIASALVETGAQPATAQLAATAALSRIEGALILARALGNVDAFTSQVNEIAADLIAARSSD